MLLSTENFSILNNLNQTERINKVLGISYLRNQSTSMKKRKQKPKEKDQKQNWGALWTTMMVVHMFRDIQQQNVWYWPPTTTFPLASSAPSKEWRLMSTSTLTTPIGMENLCHGAASSRKPKRGREDKTRRERETPKE
jgi:hypothetical protein